MSEDNSWTGEGASILAGEQLASIRHYLENVGFVVVLWWHYFGSQAPTRLTFDSYDEFVAFVTSEPREGDAVDVWPFPSDPKARIAYGKIPNERGEVPKSGAY